MRSIHRNSVSVVRLPVRSGRLRRVIRAMVAVFGRRSRRRSPSVHALRHLSEHLRRDIGISP